MKYLKAGDAVLVHIPDADKANHRAVVKYHGQEMTVSKRRMLRSTTDIYYELEGAESEHGIPYGFAKDWLIPL